MSFLGERHGEDLARLYASADLFCFPSTTDTFGQVLLEAGASGLPVVAARAGGAPELVADGVERPARRRPTTRRRSPRRSATLAGSPELRDALRRAGAGARGSERSWARSLEELRAAYVAATEASAPTEVEPLPLASARPA